MSQQYVIFPTSTFQQITNYFPKYFNSQY